MAKVYMEMLLLEESLSCVGIYTPSSEEIFSMVSKGGRWGQSGIVS